MSLFLRLLLIVSIASAGTRASQKDIDPVMKHPTVNRITSLDQVTPGLVCLSADDWYHAWQGIDTKDFIVGTVCVPQEIYLKRAKLEGIAD